MTDRPMKILEDLNALEASGVERADVLPPGTAGSGDIFVNMLENILRVHFVEPPPPEPEVPTIFVEGQREGQAPLHDGKDWMQLATELGWSEQRLESAAEMLLRSGGFLLRVTPNVIAIRCGSGNLWRMFRENSSACLRQGELEISDIPQRTEPAL